LAARIYPRARQGIDARNDEYWFLKPKKLAASPIFEQHLRYGT